MYIDTCAATQHIGICKIYTCASMSRHVFFFESTLLSWQLAYCQRKECEQLYHRVVKEAVVVKRFLSGSVVRGASFEPPKQSIINCMQMNRNIWLQFDNQPSSSNHGVIFRSLFRDLYITGVRDPLETNINRVQGAIGFKQHSMFTHAWDSANTRCLSTIQTGNHNRTSNDIPLISHWILSPWYRYIYIYMYPSNIIKS